jgi:hypothetical protein
MNENENVGFDDFENALFGGDYQFDDEDGDFEPDETDDAEDGDVIDDSADDDADSDDEDEAEEAEEEEEESDEEESEEEPAEEAEGEEEKPGDTDAGQTFTLKVNKEERQVTLEEMTALAQKGADYDRVKEQYTKGQQTIQDLQTQLNSFSTRKGALDVLEIVAEKTGTKLEEMAEMLYVSVRKSAGASEEVAREELKSAKLERELNGMKAQQTKTQQQKDDAEARAQREIDAFRKEYPDVQLTEELVSKLNGDLQKGISLAAAYRNLEKAQDAAKIQELQQQLAAKKQNDKNKKRSPGSQKDSGGRRTRSDYEDFERALFG